MNFVYLIVRYKDTKKTIRRKFVDVLTALSFVHFIPVPDFADITEIVLEIH